MSTLIHQPGDSDPSLTAFKKQSLSYGYAQMMQEERAQNLTEYRQKYSDIDNLPRSSARSQSYIVRRSHRADIDSSFWFKLSLGVLVLAGLYGVLNFLDLNPTLQFRNSGSIERLEYSLFG